jgi:hypothetical protein
MNVCNAKNEDIPGKSEVLSQHEQSIKQEHDGSGALRLGVPWAWY